MDLPNLLQILFGILATLLACLGLYLTSHAARGTLLYFTTLKVCRTECSQNAAEFESNKEVLDCLPTTPQVIQTIDSSCRSGECCLSKISVRHVPVRNWHSQDLVCGSPHALWVFSDAGKPLLQDRSIAELHGVRSCYYLGIQHSDDLEICTSHC